MHIEEWQKVIIARVFPYNLSFFSARGRKYEAAGCTGNETVTAADMSNTAHRKSGTRFEFLAGPIATALNSECGWNS